MPGDHEPGPTDDPRPAAGVLGRTTPSPPLEPPPLELDVTRSVTSNRWGRLVPVGAAVATIVAAGTLVVATQQTPREPMLGAGAAGAGIGAAGPAGLIVRDGDLVEASGPVEEGSRMCSPAPVLAISGPCLWGIRVPGVEPTEGVTLRGRWHPDRLSDIQRLPYSPPATGVHAEPYLPDTPPCPAPPGGWSESEDWLHKGLDGPVDDYLRAHAERFAEPFATHVGNARILVVEVVSGDVDRARAALRAIYTENLCVVAAPGGRSIAAEERLQATIGEAVGALMDGTGRSGIYLADSEDGRIRVMMIQLTQPLYDELAAIGLDHLIIDPWIRPAGR